MTNKQHAAPRIRLYQAAFKHHLAKLRYLKKAGITGTPVEIEIMCIARLRKRLQELMGLSVIDCGA